MVTETTLCPLECITYDSPSFLEKNETFLLTMVGSVSALIGVLLSHCIKSRCSNIKLGCLSCSRVPLPPSQYEEPTPAPEP